MSHIRRARQRAAARSLRQARPRSVPAGRASRPLVSHRNRRRARRRALACAHVSRLRRRPRRRLLLDPLACVRHRAGHDARSRERQRLGRAGLRTGLEQRLVASGRQPYRPAHHPSLRGPYPPDKTHDYTLTVYALDCELGLSEGYFLNEFRRAVRGHVLDEASLELPSRA